MENQTEQDKARQEALEESLKRGAFFEELIRTKGWEFIKAWYQNKVQSFASSLLLSDQKDIGSFESERRELIGLRKLLGMIQSDIDILRKHEEDKRSAKK